MTSNLFTLQLGPNNPNKWVNWEINSIQIEQWKLINHIKWAEHFLLQLIFRMQSSSPSFIWALYVALSLHRAYTTYRARIIFFPFFFRFFPSSALHVIQLFNLFSICSVLSYSFRIHCEWESTWKYYKWNIQHQIWHHVQLACVKNEREYFIVAIRNVSPVSYGSDNNISLKRTINLFTFEKAKKKKKHFFSSSFLNELISLNSLKNNHKMHF